MRTALLFSAASLGAFAFLVGTGCGTASTETTTLDAGAGVPRNLHDAGTDAASSQTWCGQQPTHDFCADFDGVDPFSGWTQVDYDNDDSVATAPSDRSPPNALLITGPGDPSSAGTFLGGNLLENIAKGAPTTIHFALDVRVDASTVLDDANGVRLLSIDSQSLVFANTSEGIVGLTLKKSGAVLSLFNPETDAGAVEPQTFVPLSQPFPIGAWTHVELVCTSGASGISVVLSLDGADVAQGTLHSDAFTTGQMGFEVSAFRGAGTPSGAFLGTFDNVTIDLS